MDTLRRISITADEDGTITATNRRGITLPVDPDGMDGFTPVELLLAALGSCGVVDLALLMRKQRDPIGSMIVEVEGEKVDMRMTWLRVTYHLDEPHDPVKLERARSKAAEDLCTVSRTLSCPVEHVIAP